MGARDWHVTRAKRHLEVAEFLAANQHFDWASVALFYSAHQWVHSLLADEPGLVRDERHPRKHTMPAGDDGRGTTQLVAALYPSIEIPYKSLFDMSWRTRYDYNKLASGLGQAQLWGLLFAQYNAIRKFSKGLSGTREKISTQAP